MEHWRTPEKYHERLQKHQERIAKRLILSTGFQDKILAETISRASHLDILSQFSKLAEPVSVCAVPDVEKAEVLVDSRGHRSFQRVK